MPVHLLLRLLVLPAETCDAETTCLWNRSNETAYHEPSLVPPCNLWGNHRGPWVWSLPGFLSPTAPCFSVSPWAVQLECWRRPRGLAAPPPEASYPRRPPVWPRSCPTRDVDSSSPTGFSLGRPRASGSGGRCWCVRGISSYRGPGGCSDVPFGPGAAPLGCTAGTCRCWRHSYRFASGVPSRG